LSHCDRLLYHRGEPFSKFGIIPAVMLATGSGDDDVAVIAHLRTIRKHRAVLARRQRFAVTQRAAIDDRITPIAREACAFHGDGTQSFARQ